MSAEHHDLPAPPRRPLGHSPLRRPDSVRRTSSIDMTWPQGRAGQMRLECRARDLYTPASGAPIVLAEDVMRAGTMHRTIEWIEMDAPRVDLTPLVGEQAGAHLREVLQRALPEEHRTGTPLYLLLDDLSGSTLIAPWAWSRWDQDWTKQSTPAISAIRKRMEGVCIGFRPGSSALAGDGTSLTTQNASAVVPLPHPDDPLGWHALEENRDVAMRRARRIDAWFDDAIRIDATFQDSATTPDGGRAAIHEYHLSAVADPATQTLVSVVADARTLPFRECPSAAANVHRLHGVPLRELRNAVLHELRKTQGCTHLNDALRALAEVPLLLEAAREHRDTFKASP